jgi:integrase
LRNAAGTGLEPQTRGKCVDLMATHKRKNRAGKTIWFYMFSLPGSTRQNRKRVSASGFATKADAINAETRRRIEEEQKAELAKRGFQPAEVPTTLSMLLEEFFAQHVDGKLAPKTAERYHQQATYLHPELLKMSLKEITALHLSREWKRLVESGGHHRQTKVPRPLSKKTVQNVAGVLSSAFKRAIKWGLVTTNPVSASEPPVPKKRRGIALTTMQLEMFIAAATRPWYLSTFLEVAAGTGARRGEVLALRWSDIVDGRAVIARSLTQTKLVLEFKCTKTEDSVRPVTLPLSTLRALERHRKQQDELRLPFGPDYHADQNLIFANPNGTPVKPDSVSAAVSALCRRLKLPKGVNLHTLRHTHGSHLLAAGMEITAVSERLGHSSPRVTYDIYSHAMSGRDKEAARLWDKFQGRDSVEKQKGELQ